MNKKLVQDRERKILGVLGPANTYSDLAAKKYLSRRRPVMKIQHFRTVTEIFDAVEKSKVEEGIVPLENVIFGSVRETYDRLFNSNVHIREKLKMDIKHALVVLPGAKKSGIHIIASHEQAIQQCRDYLAKHFPFAQKEYFSSTMAALEKMVSEDDRGMAAIVPLQAAKGLPLKILAENIQDQAKNVTTFIIIKKGPCLSPDLRNSPQPETSIAFHFQKDSPGRLYMVFREFANAGINLSHIESRPSAEELGNYIFFLNFDCSAFDPKAAEVLDKIKSKVAGMKILGVYGRI